MNREIKFRAWAVTSFGGNDEPLYEMLNPDRLALFEYGLLADLLKSKEACIFMQYTGLKDKNGKEIYEGDVIEDKDGNRAVVVWIKEWAMFGSMFADEFAAYKLGGVKELDESMFWTFPIENSKVKVIGNIHENPELIA